MDADLDRERQRLIKRMTTKPVDPLAPPPPTPYEIAQSIADDLLAEETANRGREVWDGDNTNLP